MTDEHVQMSDVHSDVNTPRKPASNSDLTVGMFHPKAGTRSAGGVAVFVQETAVELAERESTFLYTDAGSVVEKLQRSQVEAVSIHRHTGWESLRQFAGRLRVRELTSQQISESLSTLVNAALGGVLDHMERTVDVLFTHNLIDTMLLSNVVDVPVVRIFHGCQETGFAARAAMVLSRPAARVANSRQTAAEIATKLDRRVDGVVYPGVRADQFHPDRTPAFDDDEFVVLFVGRFVREKGLHNLLDAFIGIDEGAHLYVVGRGDERSVHREISSRGIEESVTIVGEVPHDRLPSYYTAADAVCLPSHYESFGMVNLEAMSCGRAVVTTDLPAVRVYATHGENCLLVPPGDTPRLRASLARLKESRELRGTLESAARSVARRYTWSSSAVGLTTVGEAAAVYH